MLELLSQIEAAVESKLVYAKSLADVEDLRLSMLGRKGELTQLLKSIGSLAPAERKAFGQEANRLRTHIQKRVDSARTRLTAAAHARAIEEETVDITLPGTRKLRGRYHPISQTTTRLCNMFLSMGFSVVHGPHIETVYHNFDALNTPFNHPSRDMTDTFFITEDFVLRTHTSPMQVRVMEQQKPPIRVVVPGQVFRNDEIDASHTPVFHQMEGLYVDKGVTMGDLKGILELIVRFLFEDDAQIRLRPSHFPFTEPSAEVDVSCFACKRGHQSCRVCKGSGWFELFGCGMVHPKVLSKCGIDPTVYSGYAFGLGLDRITSTVYGITTPRSYFDCDMQFLAQF